MRRVMEKKGSTPMLVEYLHEPPDPRPRPMNSAYLEKRGFAPEKGNCYSLNEVRVHYDGASWWVYYFCAMFRVETIEEFEKLVVI